MLNRDELDQSTVNFWTENFQNEPIENNIFKKFHDLEIKMRRDTFEALFHQDSTHVRIYMGLDENNNPKLIAVAAYQLDSIESLTLTYADLIVNKKVYDLTTSQEVAVEDAKKWTQKWYDTNKTNELYKTAFIFPRADFIQLFERDGSEEARIDFGIEKQIKPMVNGLGVTTQTGVYDFASPCPPVCDDYSPIIPGEDK